ncbi:MAG: long-chain fatty acid--CoA ligase [Desulfatibacillum sp.]|nr:long-chain fatty acid--CoA ligase [Desulfatibacillum sp.]
MKGTIQAVFNKNISQIPDKPALLSKAQGQWITQTWGDYGKAVLEFSKCLLALGVEKGTKVALMGKNSAHWFVADMAIMTMGAVSVPIYETNSGPQIAHILNHAGCKVFLIDSLEYFLRMESHREGLDQPCKAAFFMPQDQAHPLVMRYEVLQQFGRAVPDKEVEQARNQVTPETVCTFIYTSGTTGPPKAVMLTHKNCLAAAENVHLTLSVKAAASSSCSYLPLSHVAERTVNLFSPLFDGKAVYFMGGWDQFQEYLAEIRPTIWAGVPRVWEKLHEAVAGYLAAQPPLKQKAAKWALATGLRFNRHLYDKKAVPPGLRISHKIARMLVLKKLLRALGMDRVETAVTGGAVLSREVLEFFFALGIWLQDVYGQTEGHGTTSFATRDAVRFGSAGKPYPLVKVRIAEDGEILVKGDNVSPGYFREPELTRETFRDGWLYSGDLGRIDEDGFLWVTGRKKDIIITSGGKNITPAKIESSLMSSPLVEHAVVVGEGRKFLTALLTISPEAGAKFLGMDSTPPLDIKKIISNPKILEAVDAHVREINSQFSRVEQIKKHTVLDQTFSPDTGELTHLQKLKRNVVVEKYRDSVEKMYQA